MPPEDGGYTTRRSLRWAFPRRKNPSPLHSGARGRSWVDRGSPDVRLASVLGARPSRGPRWRRAHSIGLARGRSGWANEGRSSPRDGRSQALRVGNGDLLRPATRPSRRPSPVLPLASAPRNASGVARVLPSASWTTPTTSPSRRGVPGSAAASPESAVWSVLALVRRHSRLQNRPSYQLNPTRVRRRLPYSPTSPPYAPSGTAHAGREWTP